MHKMFIEDNKRLQVNKLFVAEQQIRHFTKIIYSIGYEPPHVTHHTEDKSIVGFI